MTIIIEHKNKVVEFYDLPAEVANSIESILHAIEIEKSDIISVESELDRNGKREFATKDPEICEYLNRIANGGDTYPSDIKL